MSNSVSRELSPPCCRTHVMLGGSTLPSTTCSDNACFKWPQAMKTPTTRTRCATIPSSNCCLIACRKPVPPWPHNRRYHALKTASHAPRSTAWRWCWWINFSPPIATHPRSSCSMSMTPRTGPMGDRNRPVTTPIMAAIAFCRCTSMKVSQGALSPPFSRPSVSPVPRGWRCSNAWSSGCVTPGPTPC